MDQTIFRSTEAELDQAEKTGRKPEASAYEIARWVEVEMEWQQVEPMLRPSWFPRRQAAHPLTAHERYDRWRNYIRATGGRIIPRWQFFGEEHGYDGPEQDGPPVGLLEPSALLSRLEAERTAASYAVRIRTNEKVCAIHRTLDHATNALLGTASALGRRIGEQLSLARHS